MFKKEVQPLSEGFADAISKSINRLQYVSEAKASRDADKSDGDVKAQDISGEEDVKSDGSASKAPTRKADKTAGESMEKVKEEVELDEACSKHKKEELDPVNPKAVKKDFKDRKDKDIDNDGEVDSSDEYLHKRRKAVSKALAKESVEVAEAKKLEKSSDDPCWKDYVQVGTKKKDGKEVPNCVPKEEVEQVEEAYKTPAEAKAYEAGKKAWRAKKKYDTNPNKKGTKEHTAWSKGHNDARAKFVKKYGSNEEKMRYESVELDEARGQDELYFDTYSAAVQYAKAKAEKMGYEVEEDDWFRQVTTGKGKPGRGKTTRHVLKLTKNGKPTRKGLAIQVYNRETDKKPYELNSYVS